MSRMIFGKEIFTTLSEIISPKHTALIIVDAQNDFCSPGGIIDNIESSDLTTTRASIIRLMELLAAARKAKVMVIYTQATNYPSYIFKSSSDIARKTEYLDPNSPLLCIDGKWGYSIVEELKPLPEEVIIKKHRHSSFAGTSLDMLLRSNGIRTVVVSGFTTERCVLATVTAAIANDYYVVVPKDCVAAPNMEMHNAALTVISGNLCREGVTESARIIGIWQ